MGFNPETHAAPHLPWRELHCWNRLRDAAGRGVPFNGIRPGGLVAVYPLDWRASRAIELAELFEVIREGPGEGRPIVPLSAYRAPVYNARVPKAAPGSQHVQGRALDLPPPAGLPVVEFFRRIHLLAPYTQLRGLGLYLRQGFVHVDTRPVERLVVFAGDREAAEIVRTLTATT